MHEISHNTGTPEHNENFLLAASLGYDAFGYNARSEVTAASILANTYSYAYDNIGSHATSTVNSATTTYTANALNQYASILCAPAPLREPFYDSDGKCHPHAVSPACRMAYRFERSTLS